MAMAYQSTSVPSVRSEAPKGPEDYWSLEKCKRAYTNYLEDKREEIDEQQDARRYRHGAQWTAAQVEIFNLRKQPVVTYNRIGRKIDAIVGLMEKLKQDPKGFPRNPRNTDAMGAELATASIRYVVESDLKEHRFPFCIEMGAVDGIGGVEMILTEGDQQDTDVGFAIVDTDSFFYDPRSYRHDFSDARYMGVGKWLDEDDVKDLVPDMAEEVTAESGSGSEFTSNPDRDKWWFENTNEHKRIRVVEIWYKHGKKWCWCLFTGSMKLQEGEGYFFNEKNQHICKFIMFSSFIDHDGDRYGFVRHLRSSQDEINQRRSKGLHELSSRRIMAEIGAFDDVELARREAVRPDGVVLRQKGFEAEFDDAARIANVEGQLKFLEDAKNEIENFGPNPALIGQGLEYKSGRAINLLQQAGIAELGPFVICVKNWKLRLYRAIWNAVQRYWQAERWIRVTDDEGIAQFIQINGVGVDEQTGMPILVNAIGQLDVNFMIEEGPDEVNMMGDAYDTLVALATQGANIPPEVLLELAPLHSSIKKKLLAMLSKPDPAQEMAKQIALMNEKAEGDKTKSETSLNMAKAQEITQGNPGEIMEKRMEMAQKEREGQLKERELVMKIQAKEREQQLDLAGKRAEMSIDLEGQRQQTQLKVQDAAVQSRVNQAQGAQKMQQSEQQHQLKMKQQKQQFQQQKKMAPKGNGGKK